MQTRVGVQFSRSQIDSVMKAFDSEILSKGGHIAFDTQSGLAKMFKAGEARAFATVPIDILAKESKFIGAKYGAKLENVARQLQLGSGKYMAVISDPKFISATTNQILNKAAKFIPGLSKFTAKGYRFVVFLGKQVVKCMLYFQNMPTSNKLYTDDEYAAIGNAELNRLINNRIKAEKAKSGATYIPEIRLDSRDKQTFDQITEYQNTYAKMFNQPELITVAYSKFRNEPVEAEFKELWDQIGSGNYSTPTQDASKPGEMKKAELKDLDLTKPQDATQSTTTSPSTEQSTQVNPNNQMGRFGLYESGIITSFNEFKKIK